MTVKRYALARSGIGRSRPEEGIKRLRLVRMEAIAELDRERRPTGKDSAMTANSTSPRRCGRWRRE